MRFVSGGIDGKIKFWYFKENKFAITKEILAHDDWIRDVASWSQVGNLLAVSGGDNQVIVLKESPNGEWVTVSKVNEEGVLEEIIVN